MYRVIVTLKLAVFTALLLTGVTHAQVGDPRVTQLQEQIRQLNGQIEELNFQLLQMQENIRKQQEDMEYRIQELEDQKQGAVEPSAGQKTRDVAEAQPDNNPSLTMATEPRLGGSQTADGGAPPRNLGAITLDENGNIVDTSIDFSAQSVERSVDGAQVASVSGEMNAEDLYKAGYGYILSGDYKLAEGVFSTFSSTYPDDPLIADARFWLGESLLAQGKYEDAVDEFIDVRTQYPNAAKAPETMYKIGTIMAALGNREVACVTFADAVQTHTNMSQPLRKKIDEERAKAKC
jgi:tol-pal system protein YbgF